MLHQQNRSEKHQACYIKETEDVGGRKISAREELEAAIVKVKKKKKNRKKERKKNKERKTEEEKEAVTIWSIVVAHCFAFRLQKLLGSGFINVLCNLSMKK